MFNEINTHMKFRSCTLLHELKKKHIKWMRICCHSRIPARWLQIGHSECVFSKCPLDALMSLRTHWPVHPKQTLSMRKSLSPTTWMPGAVGSNYFLPPWDYAVNSKNLVVRLNPNVKTLKPNHLGAFLDYSHQQILFTPPNAAKFDKIKYYSLKPMERYSPCL